MKNFYLSLQSLFKLKCGISLLVICLLFSGCVANQTIIWKEYKIFCGMSSKNGEVSEEAWENFCKKYVSTAFPNGYSVIDAVGYWRSDSSVTEKERSKIILLLAPATEYEKVLLVAKQYRKQFAQESVLISGFDVEVNLEK